MQCMYQANVSPLHVIKLLHVLDYYIINLTTTVLQLSSSVFICRRHRWPPTNSETTVHLLSYLFCLPSIGSLRVCLLQKGTATELIVGT